MQLLVRFEKASRQHGKSAQHLNWQGMALRRMLCLLALLIFITAHAEEILRLYK
jgi:hypothetical protein